MIKNDIKDKILQLDDLFSTEEQRANDLAEKVVDINLAEIDSFKNHPFKVVFNAELFNMAESIKENGVLVPAIVRPKNGRYEMISGHRRKKASEIAGNLTIPCIVRDLTDDEATSLKFFDFFGIEILHFIEDFFSGIFRKFRSDVSGKVSRTGSKY